jgi:hypothetical protein
VATVFLWQKLRWTISRSGYGAIFSDSFNEAVWAYFKPAGGETVEAITSTIAELHKFGPGFMI